MTLTKNTMNNSMMNLNNNMTVGNVSNRRGVTVMHDRDTHYNRHNNAFNTFNIKSAVHVRWLLLLGVMLAVAVSYMGVGSPDSSAIGHGHGFGVEGVKLTFKLGHSGLQNMYGGFEEGETRDLVPGPSDAFEEDSNPEAISAVRKFKNAMSKINIVSAWSKLGALSQVPFARPDSLPIFRGGSFSSRSTSSFSLSSAMKEVKPKRGAALGRSGSSSGSLSRNRSLSSSGRSFLSRSGSSLRKSKARHEAGSAQKTKNKLRSKAAYKMSNPFTAFRKASFQVKGLIVGVGVFIALVAVMLAHARQLN